DRNTGELVTRGDYVVLREGGKSMLCDIRACYSEKELTRICELYYSPLDKPAYLNDIDEFEELEYPYIEKYVYRDGIVYPLVITFRVPEGDTRFYSDLPFEYAPSEVTESEECILTDDLLDPGDRAYQIAASLADEYYRRFASDLSQLPSDNIHDFSRGYITKITSEMTDRYIICQAEVINYTGLLKVATGTAWFIIILSCFITALILCRKAKHKREIAEYERSVTNALAHNYKSSLMIVRSCAENLIAGVSEEKKTQIATEKNEIYKELIKNITPSDLLPGILNCLIGCKEEGLKVALASVSKNAPFIIERLGVGGYFDYIADANKIARSKPFPDIFLDCVGALGFKPDECIGVEDAQAGIEAITAAGMKAVGVGSPESMKEADVILGSTAELSMEVFRKLIP
ncbi:MAG: HAD-IA family hydrolase, partial [Butyrivibrio sp.]|nr:HAD-IA family hydrolase [Butyrivibrio sp.]